MDTSKNKHTETPFIEGKPISNDGHIVYVPIYSGKSYIASISTYGRAVNEQGECTGMAGRHYTDKLGAERTTRVVTDGKAEANACFIVTCCNNFEAMREALRAVDAYFMAGYPQNRVLKEIAVDLVGKVLSQIEDTNRGYK